MKTIGPRVLVVLVAVALASTLLSGCTPGPTLLFGIHSDVTWDVESSRISSTLDAEKGINSKVVRTTLRWNVTEPTQGTYDWAKADYVVAQAVQRQMQVYFVVRDAPQWANGSTDPKVVPSAQTAFTTFVTRFKTFFKAAVQRYKGKVKYWEIWSEPNENHYWQPSGLTPKGNKSRWIDLYVQLFKSTVAYAQAADPKAKLAVGALTGLGGGCCITGVDFLKGLISRQVTFPYLPINPHTGHNQAPWDCDPTDRSFCDIQKIRTVLVNNNRSNVEIWVAEFGWQVGAFTRKGTTTTRLRVPGNEDRLNLWPASGDVVVDGQTFAYSSITRTPNGYSDINLSSPLPSVPPLDTQVSSPQAEQTHAAYVRAAYEMMKGSYEPAPGRAEANYGYVKMAIYFLSFDKTITTWGMYGLFRTPRPNYDDPPNWILDPKPAAVAFSEEATTQ